MPHCLPTINLAFLFALLIFSLQQTTIAKLQKLYMDHKKKRGRRNGNFYQLVRRSGKGKAVAVKECNYQKGQNRLQNRAISENERIVPGNYPKMQMCPLLSCLFLPLCRSISL